MKTVLVCRHSKTQPGGDGIADRERKLTSRGRKDATSVASQLSKRGLKPDLIVASDALRAKETTTVIARAFDTSTETLFLPELYTASASTILDAIATYAAESDIVMVVGHNPGMEEVVSRFTDGPVRMRTSTVAILEIDEDRALPEYPLTGLSFVEAIEPE